MGRERSRANRSCSIPRFLDGLAGIGIHDAPVLVFGDPRAKDYFTSVHPHVLQRQAAFAYIIV